MSALDALGPGMCVVAAIASKELGVRPLVALIVVYVGTFLIAYPALGCLMAGNSARQLRMSAWQTPMEMLVAAARALERLAHSPTVFTAWLLPRNCDLGRVASVLGSRGLLGRCIRLQVKPEPCGPAFEQPFEPVLLHRRNPALHLLRGHEAAEADFFRDYLNLPAGSNVRARVGRWLTIAVLLIASVLLLYYLLASLKSGRVPGGELTDVLLALAVFYLSFSGWQLFMPCEWYLVPGAIIVRTAHWRSGKWRVHLYPRERSILMHDTDRNLLAIADEHGSFTRVAKPEEADAAIRAWLSPLPPPTLAQLSDLR